MKIAFVHDWIVHEGWAEAVLRHLIESRDFEEANIFVLFSNHTIFEIHGNNYSSHSPLKTTNSLNIITALPLRLNNVFVYFNSHKIPLLSTLFDYRNLMFWFPLLCKMLRRKIKRYNPEEIVISSFAAVKNVVRPWNHSQHKQNSKTTLYLHSPMQYIWENYNENLKKLQFPIKQLYIFATKYLRPRDKQTRHYDTILCNSNYTAELAKQLYLVEWQVEYPTIHWAFMAEYPVDNPKEYFIFVWRVQRYVREIDRVITLCNTKQIPLIVIGNWPDIEYAKTLAGPTILFVGHIQHVHEKIAIMKYARGIINLAKESFGMATAEALCLGIPVFGYNGWATRELVNNTNWILVADKSPETLQEWFDKFLWIQFDRKMISINAQKIFFK